jgi:hypothetical protein
MVSMTLDMSISSLKAGTTTPIDLPRYIVRSSPVTVSKRTALHFMYLNRRWKLVAKYFFKPWDIKEPWNFSQGLRAILTFGKN